MNDIWKAAENWHRKPIRLLATPVSGQVDPRIEPYASLPHINGESMEAGTSRLLPYRLAKEDGMTSGKFHFHAGAILYSKIRPYLRKAVQVPVEGICSADVYAFETISPELEPRFFMYSLIAPRFTTYANTLSGRTRMPKLNQKQLFAFELSYPPLSQQRDIVAYLDNLQEKSDALKKVQTETAAELDALMPSILNMAFRGEL
jgi:type I restriction enzyme S subunit